MNKRRYMMLAAMVLTTVSITACGGETPTLNTTGNTVDAMATEGKDLTDISVYKEVYGTTLGYEYPAGFAFSQIELEVPSVLRAFEGELENAQEFVCDDRYYTTDTVDLYDLDEKRVGYFKAKKVPEFECYNGEWCVIKCFDGHFLVKTTEMDAALKDVDLFENIDAVAGEELTDIIAYRDAHGTTLGFEFPAGYYLNQLELEVPCVLRAFEGELENAKTVVTDENYRAKEPIDLYDLDGNRIGYFKKKKYPQIECYNDEWCIIKCWDGHFMLKTPELDAVLKNASLIEKEPAEPEYTITKMHEFMYAKQSVNYRMGPSTDYEIAGQLALNEYVIVIGQTDNGWYQFSFGDGRGFFVKDSYLSYNKVEVPVEQNPTVPETPVTPENPVVPETPVTPEEPEKEKPSPEEVLNFIHETLQGAGIQYYPDVYPDSEFGPTGGMGWSEGADDPNYIMENPDQIIAPFKIHGYTLYYVEYIGEDKWGNYIIRMYWGGAQ